MSALPRIAALAAALLLAAAAPDDVSGGGITLHSVSVDLPEGDPPLPSGPGVDLVTNNCTACHSPGMILTQPALTKAEWTGEVTKMLKVYKAPVDDADVPAIVAYLTAMTVAR